MYLYSGGGGGGGLLDPLMILYVEEIISLIILW